METSTLVYSYEDDAQIKGAILMTPATSNIKDKDGGGDDICAPTVARVF